MRKREEEEQGERKKEERKLEGAEKDMGNLGEENKEGERERIQGRRERNGERRWGEEREIFFWGPVLYSTNLT